MKRLHFNESNGVISSKNDSVVLEFESLEGKILKASGVMSGGDYFKDQIIIFINDVIFSINCYTYGFTEIKGFFEVSVTFERL